MHAGWAKCSGSGTFFSSPESSAAVGALLLLTAALAVVAFDIFVAREESRGPEWSKTMTSRLVSRSGKSR